MVSDPSARSECRDLMKRARQGEAVSPPVRGKFGHPLSCWRAFNTGITEMKLHKDGFAQILPKAPKTNVFPGLLDELKKLSL